MKYVIVGIDGTLTRVGKRLRYLIQNPPDWDAFYDACCEDEPMNDMIRLINLLNGPYWIVLCTGRRESVREKTLKYLLNNKMLPPLYCLFRKDGDTRHDTEVKPELLMEAGIKFDDIEFVIEDRYSMVKKWRNLGLRCLQCANGVF